MARRGKVELANYSGLDGPNMVGIPMLAPVPRLTPHSTAAEPRISVRALCGSLQ